MASGTGSASNSSSVVLEKLSQHVDQSFPLGGEVVVIRREHQGHREAAQRRPQQRLDGVSAASPPAAVGEQSGADPMYPPRHLDELRRVLRVLLPRGAGGDQDLEAG